MVSEDFHFYISDDHSCLVFLKLNLPLSCTCLLQVLIKLNLCFTIEAYTNCFLLFLPLRNCLQYLLNFLRWFLLYFHWLEVSDAKFVTIKVSCELIAIIDEEIASKEGGRFTNSKIFSCVPLKYLLIRDLHHTGWESL